MRWIQRLELDWRMWVSAALIVLAAPPFNFSLLIWFALVPWLIAMERADTTRKALLQGFWLGYAVSLGAFYWVASVLAEFGNLPWPVALLGLLLFAAIGQPQCLLFGPVQSWLGRRRGTLSCVLAALLYAGIDWILPKLFADTLGHTLVHAPRLRQAADLGGPHLLTFAILLVNLGLWRLWQATRSRGTLPSLLSALPAASMAVLPPLALLVYGDLRLKQVHEWMKSPLGEVQVAMIQGNIGDFDKLASERGIRGAARRVLDTMFSLSGQALALAQRPSIIIWPETTYPSTFRTPSNFDEKLRDDELEQFARNNRVSLLFGGYDRFAGKDYNSFFFLGPDGSLQTYHKSILLLFGEYIPGMDGGPLSFLKSQFPQIGNFGRGPGPEVLTVATGNPSLPQVRLGPLICYEALFPSFILEAARKGSQIIANVTNDSWFGMSSEPELHLALSAFRSIEARLPQLRSTNTGVTALVLPDGEIARRSALFVPEVVNVSTAVYPPLPTLMLAWGDWFGPTALLAGMLGAMALWGASRRRLSREQTTAV